MNIKFEITDIPEELYETLSKNDAALRFVAKQLDKPIILSNEFKVSFNELPPRAKEDIMVNFFTIQCLIIIKNNLRERNN